MGERLFQALSLLAWRNSESNWFAFELGPASCDIKGQKILRQVGLFFTSVGGTLAKLFTHYATGHATLTLLWSNTDRSTSELFTSLLLVGEQLLQQNKKEL